MKFKHKKTNKIKEVSNIIQADDLGYPLLLCIMEDDTQRWIDVGLDWAKEKLNKGELHLLEWNKFEEK